MLYIIKSFLYPFDWGHKMGKGEKYWALRYWAMQLFTE